MRLQFTCVRSSDFNLLSRLFTEDVTYLYTFVCSALSTSEQRLLRYATESVVDPKITRNVKLFQMVKIVIYILAFAHLIGCFYYWLARIYLFDETTWIHSIEGALPYYEHGRVPYSGEYLLVVFKGFCRVAALGYDPGLPGNIPELLWATFVMFLSVYVSSLILGTLLTFLVRRDPMEVAHKERMEALHNYMLQKNVPEDLYETIMRYCQFQYNKNKTSDSISGNDLVNALSRSLQIEVANANHKSLINRCSKIGRPLHRCSEAFFNEVQNRVLPCVHDNPALTFKTSLKSACSQVYTSVVCLRFLHEIVASFCLNLILCYLVMASSIPLVFFPYSQLVIRLYTLYVMPGDHIVHKDEIPRGKCVRLFIAVLVPLFLPITPAQSHSDLTLHNSAELYFVSSGSVQTVDEHDQVVSVIRSDVPDTAPIVGEVPFFLGINYLKAMKASLERDVQLEVLSKSDMAELASEYPEDHTTICNNLWAQFDIGRGKEDAGDDLNLDKEKLLTKKRILESTNFRKEQQFNSLCKAARGGDTDTVLMLARQGANLNGVDYDGRTPMHMACTAGRYKVVECLLKLGANENIKDRWGQTPLAIAIMAKQQMIITVLASSKAKLDMESPELALCTAAGEGDLTQVKRLIEFGVAPNIGDYDKRTALHVAAAEGHEKIVEFLLLAQADPNCADRWGGSPLQDALSGGHIGTAHILKAKGAAVSDEFGASEVCAAAGTGDVPKLRMLHSFGQSLDVGDYDGTVSKCAPAFAVLNCLINSLVPNPCELFLADRYPLHLACAEGRVLAVSFLLGISADPNIKDRWSGTAMDDAVRGGTLYHRYCAKVCFLLWLFVQWRRPVPYRWLLVGYQ